MLVQITNQSVLTYFGNVQDTVYISEERFEHMRAHHPDTFSRCRPYITDVLIHPSLILADHKNARTAMFIGKTDREDLNVIVKLALKDDISDRSFVVTMYPIGEKRLRRLRFKNIVIFEHP